jgi:hypothetical protein
MPDAMPGNINTSDTAMTTCFKSSSSIPLLVRDRRFSTCSVRIQSAGMLLVEQSQCCRYREAALAIDN